MIDLNAHPLVFLVLAMSGPILLCTLAYFAFRPEVSVNKKETQAMSPRQIEAVGPWRLEWTDEVVIIEAFGVRATIEPSQNDATTVLVLVDKIAGANSELDVTLTTDGYPAGPYPVA